MPINTQFTTVRLCIVAIYLSMVAIGCAKSGVLTGGPKDIKPPEIVEGQSSLNYGIHFKGKEIKILFDEFVVIRNPTQDVLISPPLDYPPQVKVKGKEVTVKWNEKERLRDSVTYIINFGNAIEDFREGNKLENYRFIFSTGSFIDSLSVSGKVANIDGSPAANTLVLLYTGGNDSCIINSKPFYFTRSGTDGNYSIDNIASDVYRIYACSDESNNYAFNIGNESIAFLSDNLSIDSSITGTNLTLSKPKVPLKILKTTFYDRMVEVVFNIKPELPPTALSLDGHDLVTTMNDDTLRVWDQADLDSTRIVINLRDTITLRKSEKLWSQNLKLKLQQEKRLRIGDSIQIVANQPIYRFDRDSIMLIDSSGTSVAFEVIRRNGNSLHIVPNADTNLELALTLFPMAIAGLEGVSHDTITDDFNIVKDSILNTIVLNIVGLDSVGTTVLMLKMGDGSEQRYIAMPQDTYHIILNRILPQEIRIEAIFDTNNNGIWDAANAIGRIQPEYRWDSTLKTSQPGWEVEQTLDLQSSVNLESAEPTSSSSLTTKPDKSNKGNNK